MNRAHTVNSYKPYTGSEIRRIKEMFLSGFSNTVIADKFGRTPKAISVLANKRGWKKALDPLNSLKSAETPAASLQNAVPLRERQFAELDQEFNKFDAYQELLRKNKLLKESINTLLCLLIGMALAVAYIAITGA